MSQIHDVEKCDASAFHSTPDRTNSYIWLDCGYVVRLEDRLMEALTEGKGARNLTDLKLMYVVPPQWTSAPVKLGTWIARNE